MASVFIEPLDFKTIFITYFLGNPNLFGFLFVILVGFVSATLNLSNTVFLIVLTIGLIMFGAYAGFSLYTILLFLVGYIVFKAFGRTWSR